MQRVCFITLSRSDYTSTKPVIKAAVSDPDIEPIVLAGGSHLLDAFGTTINDLISDGIQINKRIDFLTTNYGVSNQNPHDLGTAIQKFSQAYEEFQPDCLFVVGDRWEMVAPVLAANMLRIPIIHHSGGDITQGSADNQTRYVLTTLSHKHFVVLPRHKKRLELMGEESDRITITGEPALTELGNLDKDIRSLEKKIGRALEEGFVLATFHPTSYDKLDFNEQVDFYISVLELIEDNIILTAPNPDPGNDLFAEKLQLYCGKNDRIDYVKFLGTDLYYSAMQNAKFMIGNSSSGLWEAPSFGLPVINFGSRQEGREHGSNVINCALNLNDAKRAIEKVTSDDFVEISRNSTNPYVQYDCLNLILSVLKEKIDKPSILSKSFVDPLITIEKSVEP